MWNSPTGKVVSQSRNHHATTNLQKRLSNIDDAIKHASTLYHWLRPFVTAKLAMQPLPNVFCDSRRATLGCELS